MHRSQTDLVGLQVTAEGFLAAVLESVAQPIWAVDAAGLIRFANPAATRALGYDEPRGVLGRSATRRFITGIWTGRRTRPSSARCGCRA